MTLLPIVAAAAMFALFSVLDHPPVAPFALVLLAATWGAIVGTTSSYRHLRRLLAIPRADRPSGLAITILASPLGALTSGFGALMTLATMASFTRGRQLRSRGRVLVASLEDQSAWVERLEAVPGQKTEAATAWRKNGLTEHASVAAFARLSTELVALGAPPRLIESAHRDALDEMRHTRLCFDLAHALDGRALGPSDFAAAAIYPWFQGPRNLRLVRLAVESLIDGALNEGLSARAVAEMQKEVTAPRVQAVLAAIAKDEARHAAHGFEVVRWCVEAGGRPVLDGLRGALWALPVELGPSITDADDLEAFGIPSRERQERIWRTMRPRMIARVWRLIEARDAA